LLASGGTGPNRAGLFARVPLAELGAKLVRGVDTKAISWASRGQVFGRKQKGAGA